MALTLENTLHTLRTFVDRVAYSKWQAFDNQAYMVYNKLYDTLFVPCIAFLHSCKNRLKSNNLANKYIAEPIKGHLYLFKVTVLIEQRVDEYIEAICQYSASDADRANYQDKKQKLQDLVCQLHNKTTPGINHLYINDLDLPKWARPTNEDVKIALKKLKHAIKKDERVKNVPFRDTLLEDLVESYTQPLPI